MNAAVINDAYKMLKKPNTRVKYLVRPSPLLPRLLSISNFRVL